MWACTGIASSVPAGSPSSGTMRQTGMVKPAATRPPRISLAEMIYCLVVSR
jgi:hypothetical protein